MKNKNNTLSRILKKKDNQIGDFDEIPRIMVDEYDDLFDLDMRCTDYGDAIEFFN